MSELKFYDPLEQWQWDHDGEKRARGMAVKDQPASGTVWRNRHCGDLVTVTKVMDCSPGGGLMYPLVEFTDGRHRSWADHDPWWALDEWHDDWELVVDGTV